VVVTAEHRFSATQPFRLLFALFPAGKRTKKLMKMHPSKLLRIRTQIMCKTAGEFAELLRNLAERPCAKGCGNPDEK